MFTFTGTYTNSNGTLRPASSENLSDAANALHESNASIADAWLGTLPADPPSPEDSSRTTLLKWARGVDVDDIDDDGSVADTRRVFGAPTHATPALVTYGGTDDNPDMTIFMMTNDGYVHAFDTDDGRELFAFVPQELLGDLQTLYENLPSAGTQHYGLRPTATPCTCSSASAEAAAVTTRSTSPTATRRSSCG